MFGGFGQLEWRRPQNLKKQSSSNQPAKTPRLGKGLLRPTKNIRVSSNTVYHLINIYASFSQDWYQEEWNKISEIRGCCKNCGIESFFSDLRSQISSKLEKSSYSKYCTVPQTNAANNTHTTFSSESECPTQSKLNKKEELMKGD